MLFRVPLNPTLAVVERFVADVDIPQDDDVAALFQEGSHAGFKVVQKVELVGKSGVVGLVWAVEVEDDEEAETSQDKEHLVNPTCWKSVPSELTRNRGRQPFPPYPAS